MGDDVPERVGKVDSMIEICKNAILSEDRTCSLVGWSLLAIDKLTYFGGQHYATDARMDMSSLHVAMVVFAANADGPTTMQVPSYRAPGDASGVLLWHGAAKI